MQRPRGRWATTVVCSWLATACHPSEPPSRPVDLPSQQVDTPTRDTSSEPRSSLPGAARLRAVEFMTGTWRMQHGDLLIEEVWTAPAGGTMLGLNRTIRGEETVAFEWLRIEARPRGLVYLAHPGGQMPGTAFELQSSEPGTAVFENLDHDFPQRIAYRRAEPDRLSIDVTGDGSPLHFELTGP